MMNDVQIFRNTEFGELPQKEANSFLGRVCAMEYGDFLKIGSSRCLKARIRALSKQCEYAGREVGEVVFTSSHTNYKENEKLVHAACSEYRIESTELYDLNVFDFVAAISSLKANDDSAVLFKRSEAVSDYFISLLTNRR